MKYRIAALAFLALSCALAQSGHWEGTLQAPNGDHQIVIDLAKSEAGAWTGAFHAPGEGIKDIPLEQIGVDGAKVKFTVSTPRATLIFAGSTSADGKTLSGTLSAMGQEMACKLTQK
jgi:hypothetical protein